MPKIPFRTGRKDCVPDQENLDKGRGYIASSKKHEVHPNPFMNGKELTDFLKVCIACNSVPFIKFTFHAKKITEDNKKLTQVNQKLTKNLSKVNHWLTKGSSIEL